MTNWPKKEFESVYEIPSRNGLSKPSRVRGSGYKMINMGELFSNNRIYDIDMELVPLTDAEKEKAKVEPGDLLFARQSLVAEGAGKCIIVMETSELTVFESHIIRVRLNQKLADPLFYYYYFRSPASPMKTIVQHCVQAGIKASDLSKLEVVVPPLSEQQKIASVFNSIDAKIENNNRINQNLQEQAFALFDHYFHSVIEGNNAIGDYITPKRGKNLLSKDAVPGEVPVVAGGLEPATYHNTANTSSPVVTISASGANSGFVRLWNTPVWSSDSSYIDSTMTPNVYFWYVMLKKRQKEIYDSQTGSAQPHIYPQHIAVMPVDSLDDALIDKYTEQVTPLFRMIGANIDENKKLICLRDTLLPKLMSGELDVSEIEL